MQSFLDMAQDGINLNYITFLKHSQVYQSDLCPHGLGVCNHLGKAWHFYLSPHFIYNALNNLLERLAAIIMPWIEVFDSNIMHGDCSLSLTDSNTSEGLILFFKLAGLRVQ